MNLLFHMCARKDWEAAQEAGAYKTPSLESEGFIHCSRPEQIEGTANRYYQGAAGQVLLHIDPAKVQAEIRWEASTGGETFPHVYGPLNLDAVVVVEDFVPNADGTFSYPQPADRS